MRPVLVARLLWLLWRHRADGDALVAALNALPR